MSYFMPRRCSHTLDPLTEHLANLQPEQVDALEMMRGVYSNQVALSSAVVALQRHLLSTDEDMSALAESTATNAAQHLHQINNELEKEAL